MDYIFKDWEKKMSAFESSVEKDLAEIRKCKADMQDMRRQMHEEMTGSYYVRDVNRIILSAPEIILGNVDTDGVLYEGAASKIIVRGTEVDLQATGNGGRVETRASSIRQIAEDPGADGLEHVVGSMSEVVSQARSIVIQSDDAQGAFAVPPTSNGGLRIHADKHLEISATQSAERKEKQLDLQIKGLEDSKTRLKERASDHKESFSSLIKELEELMEKKEKLVKSEHAIRSNYEDVELANAEVEAATEALVEETRGYSEVLAALSETNRLLKCLKDMKSKIKKGEEFLKQPTGSSVNITGERISLASVDGDGNLRDNEGSGISIKANKVGIAAVESDGRLKEKGRVSIQAMNIDVATSGTTDAAYDDTGSLTTATHTAEGDFTLRSKNITIEGTDYEVADKQLKEKQLTADSRLKLRAKTIEVSTEGSANVEVDQDGKLTKATMTAEGDIIVRSKTLTVASADNDFENGEMKEKSLAQGGSVAIRAVKVDLSPVDAEGKLIAGSSMTLLAEQMFVGAKSKDVKSKLLQAASDTVGLFAGTTFEAQQGEGKAVVQLDGGNVSVGGSKTDIYGATTINGKTEAKDEIKAPKATIDDLQAKSHFKATNIEDGVAVPAAGGAGSLSAKLTAQDAPKEA
ncbi:MAG: hypothetical protein IJ082_03405 [Prevotella sp.]|nr:hypothetical protein [Prevotella sp.]